MKTIFTACLVCLGLSSVAIAAPGIAVGKVHTLAALDDGGFRLTVDTTGQHASSKACNIAGEFSIFFFDGNTEAGKNQYNIAIAAGSLNKDIQVNVADALVCTTNATSAVIVF